jgi:hypothetical protein
MSKRKNKDPGRVRQVHQTRSFEQLVADATLNKLSGYINQEMQEMGRALVQRQAQSLQNVMTRLIALEEILMEKIEGLTKDVIVDRVAMVQDRSEGFAAANDSAVEVGDRVRLEIKTKTADQTEYQGTSRLLVDNAGSGKTLGQELENALLGMKVGEVREVIFGKEGSLTASLTINKVSRPIKEKPSVSAPLETQDESEVTEVAANNPEDAVVAAPTEENANVSVNAG